MQSTFIFGAVEVDVAGRCAYDGYLTPKEFGGGADE